NGEERTVTERGEVYREESGRPLRMLGVVQDITERVKAERARMESEERLDSFMNSATDIFTLYDSELNLIEINQAGLKMFGVAREQVIGKNMVDMQVGDEAESQINELRKVIETGEPYQHDQLLEHPIHGTRYVQIKAFKAGSGLGLISSDITESKNAEKTLYESRQHFANAQKVGKMGSWDLNLTTMKVSWSEQVDDIFKFDTSTPPSLDKLWKAIHPDDLERVRADLDAVMKGANSINVDHRAILSNGDNIFINSAGEVIYGADGKPERLLGVVQDITERMKAEEQLQLAAKVFESSLDAIMVVDMERKIGSVNKAFYDITGFDKEDTIGSDIDLIAASARNQEQGKCIKSAFDVVKGDGNYKGEIWCIGKNGREFPVWMNINSIKSEYGAEEQYVAIFHDITETKEKEREIEYQAYYDTLTGLPNRLLFQDRLKMAVARAKRENEVLALMFLDLDNFKNVNDSLGHDVGDLLLKGVSVRLVEALREIDTVARIGGDEFVILLESLKDNNEAVRVARKVIKSLNQSFKFKDKPLYATGSLGITLFPEDGMDTDTLLKNADMAMYKAKEMGKGGFQMFTSDMNEKFASRLAMENNLREAMDKDQFVVHYQPKMDIVTGAITGMEALVRWIRPDGTITSPGDFIPVAEETGMILHIGETVLRKSLKHLARMNQKIGTKLKLSVNLSARQFAQDNVVEMITLILRDTGVEPSLLELEITESSVMADVEKAMMKMKQLKKLGLKLSIDDFGTGFSSLNYLRKFPIDVLKIDRSFVMGMKKDNADTAIVDSIITIAKNLNLKVVAEGVETKSQLHMLRGLGCNEIQGYLVSRPISEDKIMDTIRNLSRHQAIA
ncbi:MAG: EAL domain-containing protein, partial [Nitrospinota bacterium]|nr:EAL domain-containing protein [Nitrospinota bacterium]